MQKEKEIANSQAPAQNEQSELMTFQFSESRQPIRNLLINSKPWFVAKDVCDILELKDTNMSIKTLDDDEKLTQKILGSGQNRNMWLISESGLYALVLRSSKPQAKLFRKWITSEVIPSILKNGYYKSVRAKQNDFIDARSIPFERYNYNNHSIRGLKIDNVVYYSINDVHKALNVSTGSNQAAKVLNVQQKLAFKILIFGNTHPAWFTTDMGLKLLTAKSRSLSNQLKLSL